MDFTSDLLAPIVEDNELMEEIERIINDNAKRTLISAPAFIVLSKSLGWFVEGATAFQTRFKYFITEHWLITSFLAVAAGARLSIGVLRTFYPVEWLLYWFDVFCFEHDEREVYKGKLVVITKNGGEKILNKLHEILRTSPKKNVRSLVAEVIIEVEGIPQAKEENRELLERLQASDVVGVCENLLKLDMPWTVPFYKTLDANNVFGRRVRGMIAELVPKLAIIDEKFAPEEREDAWQIITQSIAKIAAVDFFKSWPMAGHAILAIEMANGNTQLLKENMRVLEDIANAVKKNKWQYWWMFSFISVENLLLRQPEAAEIERLISIDLDLGYMEGKRTIRERQELRRMIAGGASCDVLEFFVNLTWACFKKFTIAERKAKQADIEGAEYINEDQEDTNFSYSGSSSVWDMVPVADMFFGSSRSLDISHETIQNRYYYFRGIRTFLHVIGEIGISVDSFVRNFNMLPEAERSQFLSSLTPYNIKEKIEGLNMNVQSEEEENELAQLEGTSVRLSSEIEFKRKDLPEMPRIDVSPVTFVGRSI
ncbi:MAG: hypothetical protein L6416_06440 [Candidatus Omnitrophica bacterium]|nr:hypothetical protein [Candidatus Omnitrophota bacterium]